MKHRGLVIGSVAAAAVFALAALPHWAGVFNRVENAAAELRDTLLERTVESDIVIVGIDAHSLEELREWPWPRQFHARLLQHLDEAEPAEVFLDIDFSSEALDPQGDEQLEERLAAWSGAPVMLAAHNQASFGGGDGDEGTRTVLARRPIERFRRHAREVSVAVSPDPDGIVRRLATTDLIDGAVVESAFAAGREREPGERIAIDFSIAPESFAYVSFSDLLNREVALDALENKRIFVGAMASELGDTVTVPRHQNLPGIVVQALAATTLEEGIPRPLPDWLLGALLAGWTALWSLAFARGSWRRQALAGFGGLVLLALSSIVLDALTLYELAVVPFAVVPIAAFTVQSVRSLDHQTLKALAYALGVRRRDALIKSVIETSMDSILCLDREGVIHTANPAASSLFVAPLRTLIGAPIRDYIPDLDNPEALANGVLAREFLARDSSKRSFPVEATISRVAVDDRELFTMFVRDVSERKEQQNKLEYQATHDPLTQLPNRAAVNSYLGTLLGSGARAQRVALLMLDLCRFKEVNDTLGHDVGDEVLRIVSRRFGQTLTDRAFIGRIGGDEFVVIVPEVAVRQALEQLAENLVESLKTPIQVRGIAIEVGLSVGIAFYPEHAGDAGELLRHADIAMYAAKRRNSAWEFYSKDDDRHSIRRLSMVSDLRAAISRNEIELLFQPQIELATGRLAGAEALLRWEHPVHGRVSPAEFVAIAESTDLIQPLTEWTIVESLKQLVSWRHSGLDTRVAVNLSARALQDVDFPRHLERLLARFGIDGRWLELEITETAMMLDPQRALAIVRDLQALGVRIAIDDFGTGYSSLGYLRDLRASALKLDKSFVIDLENRQQNRVIVESTAQMADALGLEVVAEGIESQWVCDYLRGAGYGIGQGYWFGKPMTAAEIVGRYAARAAMPRAIAS